MREHEWNSLGEMRGNMSLERIPDPAPPTNARISGWLCDDGAMTPSHGGPSCSTDSRLLAVGLPCRPDRVGIVAARLSRRRRTAAPTSQGVAAQVAAPQPAAHSRPATPAATRACLSRTAGRQPSRARRTPRRRIRARRRPLTAARAATARARRTWTTMRKGTSCKFAADARRPR